MGTFSADIGFSSPLLITKHQRHSCPTIQLAAKRSSHILNRPWLERAQRALYLGLTLRSDMGRMLRTPVALFLSLEVSASFHLTRACLSSPTQATRQEMFALLDHGIICTGCLSLFRLFGFQHSPQILKIFRATVERSQRALPAQSSCTYSVRAL